MIWLAISFVGFGIVIGISATMLVWLHNYKKDKETIELYSKYLIKFSKFIVEQRKEIKKLRNK